MSPRVASPPATPPNTTDASPSSSQKPQRATNQRNRRESWRNEKWRTSPALDGPGPDGGSESRRRNQRTAQNSKSQKPKNRLRPRADAARHRIACAMVPLFPLAARLRCEPDLHHEAVAILDGNGNTAYVVAASRKARRAGVKPGMTLTQARARCPKLIARARDEESEGTAREVLLEIAESFSPRVEEPDGEQEPFGGVIYLDLDGLERHYQRRHSTVRKKTQKKPEHSEPDGAAEFRLGRALMRRLDDAGLPAKVGIASSKLAARVAAGLAKTAAPPPDTPGEVVDVAKAHARIEPQIVPPGEEAKYLAPLPLHRLSPAGETADTLERWGIESVGDFAAISKSEVRSRLGELGHRLHLVARGVDPRPLIPRAPNHAMREGMTLEWPITHLEPFLFVAQAALERLCHRLERRGLGCKRLEMSLQLEPDGFHERSIELPAPSREAKTLLTLVRLDLESQTPGAPIVRFQFTAHPDAPRLAQLSLFGPASLSPDRLATTLARLFALLGPSRVGSPRPAPGHAPERFALVEYTPPPPPKIRRRIEPGRGLLAIRALRPPLPLTVTTDGRDVDDADEVAEPGAKDTAAADDWSRTPIRSGSSRPSRSAPPADDSDEVAEGGAAPHEAASADPRAELKAAMARASDSGLSRSAQKFNVQESVARRTGLRGDATSDAPRSSGNAPEPFSPDAEGLERQVGLFRASARCAARPLHVCSEVADQPLSAKPQSPQPDAPPRLAQRRVVPVIPGRSSQEDPSPPKARTMRIEGDVRIASGPWELEEKWWLEDRTERDYWDIELFDGTLYRVYRDRTNGRWFADGVYD